MKVIQYLSAHFISLPDIVGYLVAAALAWWPGNRFVGRQQTALHRHLHESFSDRPIGEIGKVEEEIRQFLAMELAREIGRVEKLVYVLAVMSQQYTLITAVIILKAFFGWINIPRNPFQSRELQSNLDYYYVYIYGNILSLIVGLFLGFVGRIVSVYVKDVINWIAV